VHVARYREYLPPPELRRRVVCFWTLVGTAAAPSRILPDGCMDLLFDFTFALPPSVVGAMTRALISEPSGTRVDFLGVRFQPGEAWATLGAGDARSLRDLLVPLEDVWGSRALELTERLARLTTTRARIARLVTELGAPPHAADARVRRAVQAMRERNGGVRVAEVAARVGMVERQLERLFDARVGVGPKTLASIFRVQALLFRVEACGDWARLATDLGYCDQAHLTRDLGRLAGVTPSALARALARRAPADRRDASERSDDAMSELSNPPNGPLPILGG
jgi:AraC-like DNA-binding protein